MQRFAQRPSLHLVLLPLLALQCALPKLTAVEEGGDGDGTTETDNSGGQSGDGDGDGDGSGGRDGTGDGDGDGDGSGGDNDGSGGDSTGDGDGDGDGSGGDHDGSGGDESGSGGDGNGSGGDHDGSGGDSSGPFCPGMSNAFTISDGYASNSTMCGPIVTVTSGNGEEMLPIDFAGDDLCTHGTLPLTDGDVYPFLAFVMDSQTDPNGIVETWAASGKVGAEWTTGGLAGEVRINLVGTNGTRYCVPDAISGTTYAMGDFTEECWSPGGPALSAGVQITGIELAMMATDATQTFDDFCLTNVINE